MTDTKRQKFQRLMPKRLEAAKHSISLLANLSSHNYESSEQEARDLVMQLREAVDEVEASFGFQKETPSPSPIIPIGRPGVPIPGRDRRDIRNALELLHDGETKDAIKALRKIVCGWVVPDQIEETQP